MYNLLEPVVNWEIALFPSLGRLPLQDKAQVVLLLLRSCCLSIEQGGLERELAEPGYHNVANCSPQTMDQWAGPPLMSVCTRAAQCCQPDLFPLNISLRNYLEQFHGVFSNRGWNWIEGFCEPKFIPFHHINFFPQVLFPCWLQPSPQGIKLRKESCGYLQN